MKIIKILYISGLILSLITGIWHFFVPYLFKWYSYIPDAPRPIIVSIDWINYFFSLLLTGLSLLLLFFTKQVFNKNKEVLIFYSFLVFVWFNRVIITIVHPWAYDIGFVIQLSVFIFIFAIQFIPLVWLVGRGH